MSADSRLIATAVETEPEFRIAPPQPLFTIDVREGGWFSQYDVTPGGHIVVNQIVLREPQPLKLLLGWTRRMTNAQR